MKYIQYAVIPLAVGLISPLIFSLIGKGNHKKESKMDANDFIISSSTAIYWMGIICILILSTIVILENIYGNIDIIQNAICIFMSAIFVFGLYAITREKVVIKKDTIQYTPIFGKKRYYTFSDIKKVVIVYTSRGLVAYQVFSYKKIFIISNMNIGANLFMKKIQAYGIKIKSIRK